QVGRQNKGGVGWSVVVVELPAIGNLGRFRLMFLCRRARAL
ncbi:hypothetical protein NPIL_103181, partial [Nephila pilipes]